MNKLFLFLSAFILWTNSSATNVAGGDTLTIVSYNIKNGKGADNTSSLARISEIIKNAADIIAIQECDSATVRSGGKYILGELASACGMNAFYAPAINFDGGKYGVGGALSQKSTENNTNTTARARRTTYGCYSIF